MKSQQRGPRRTKNGSRLSLKLLWLLLLLTLAPRFGFAQEPSAETDTSTLQGKVMCGYQGWFNGDGDGADLGWTHWARYRNRPLAPGNVTVDLWPDVSELANDERFATGFRHSDGRVAEVFSSFNQSTVRRHFQWMQQYGIDGAFVQRFAIKLNEPATAAHRDAVLAHARAGAEEFGRAYAVMYDLSGMRAGDVADVKKDWLRIQPTLQIAEGSAYLHHRGKPVVAVWGIGFNDGRKYSLAECHDLIRFLKDEGCTVMLGVPTGWRTGNRDCVDDPLVQQVVKMADVISPWSVGRYRTPAEATRHGESVWRLDQAWCTGHELDFLPVVFPGFSWHNLKGDPLDAIPRLQGEFLWSQVVAAKQAGCEMIYVAMFDEVDEGTAIFKCTNDPPTGAVAKFLTYEGLPSDFYLRLTQCMGPLLRDQISSDFPLSRADEATPVKLAYAPAPVDNPLKGLVPYANPGANQFPHSMEFKYLGLAELMPGPDRFDFESLEKFLDEVASRGNQSVFRVVLEYPGKKDLIPKFLIDAGLIVHRYESKNTAPFPPKQVETPDYHDPGLRAAMKQFIEELGRRYDGDPRVGYITAGMLGTWGEWHTHPRNNLWASKEVQSEIMEAYATAFKRTPILLRYPAGEKDRDYMTTVGQPFGYHDDSFAFATMFTGRKDDEWFFQSRLRGAKLEQRWKLYPIGGEIRPEVWGCCFDAAPCTKPDQSFSECRDALHVTWLMDSGLFGNKRDGKRFERAMVEVRKMGYEFHVQQATIGTSSDGLQVELVVNNTGIAPFYHAGWQLELGLIDGQGVVKRNWATDWSLQNILPGHPSADWKAELPVAEITSGCKLAVRVINPLAGGKSLKFANREQDRDREGWLSLTN